MGIAAGNFPSICILRWMGEIHSVLTDVYDVYEQFYVYIFCSNQNISETENLKVRNNIYIQL